MRALYSKSMEEKKMKTLFDYRYGFTSTENRTLTNRIPVTNPIHADFILLVNKFQTPIPL